MQTVEKNTSKYKATSNNLLKSTDKIETSKSYNNSANEKIIQNVSDIAVTKKIRIRNRNSIRCSDSVDSSMDTVEPLKSNVVIKESEFVEKRSSASAKPRISIQNFSVQSKITSNTSENINNDKVESELNNKLENYEIELKLKVDPDAETNLKKEYQETSLNKSRASPEVTASSLLQKYLSKKSLSNEVTTKNFFPNSNLY